MFKLKFLTQVFKILYMQCNYINIVIKILILIPSTQNDLCCK